jgi:oligoribonuclease NrnB/cAMP/cGMP phosphodiesterase (DHH superfamily)
LTLGIKINLESVAAVLRGAGIYGGQVLPQGGEVALVDQPRPAISAPQPATAEATPSAGQEEVPEEAPASTSGEIDPQEAALIQDIVGNLSYMVYYDEENITDQFLATTAVGMANKYLAQNGMNYVDLEQIERLKKDQEMAYEEETGQSISMIQWIANKLNADIYIEIAVDANSETKSGRYYGSASVNLKNFDASTGSGRGTAYYQTVPPAMSTVSEKDALNNAVASATYNAVQKAIEQAQLYTRQELSQGIKYTLVIQNTPDSRMMRNFEKKIERKVKNIRKLSYAPEESRYEVRLIGRITDLEDLIYDATEGVSGMEGTFLVFQRGNSITFDTGL